MATQIKLPKPTGTCRWIRPDSLVDDLLEGTALFRIAVKTLRGEVVKTYKVRYFDRGFELIERGTGNRYRVDASFGPKAEHWTCSCPDGMYRNRTCKHVSALNKTTLGLGV